MTVGNTARYQLNMAQVQTKYGDQLTQLYKTKYANRYESAAKSLDDLMNSSALKGKSDIFREQFSSLYKSIYGIKDNQDSGTEDESTASAQSVKTTSSAAGSAASAMKTMANSLKYGGEIDLDTYKTQAQGFVDSYNAMVDKLGKAENQAVLQKGVLMINTAKVYSSALNRAGMTLGSDNKLTLKEDLSKVSANDVKSTFGTNGFSDKVIQKAGQINRLSGGSGYFAPYIPSTGSSSSSDKVNNPIAVKTAASDVEKAATSLKLYLKDMGKDGSKEFDPKEYADSAKKFVDGFNKMLDETSKSNTASVKMKGLSMRSTANAYKYALKRAGIEVGADNKLTITDDIEKKTAADAKYAFGSGRFLDNVTQKAQQASALANSAREMGYNANSGLNYAYTSGALYSVYA